MTINQPCVSPGTGTLSPDLRVFYQYGMVLGLDDFLQEQTHNLSLDYHHERALHGYGTVYGLAVTTSTPAGDPADVEVTVGPGMGGRPVGPRGHRRSGPVRPHRGVAGRPGGGGARDRGGLPGHLGGTRPLRGRRLRRVPRRPGAPARSALQHQRPGPGAVAAARRLGHRVALGPARPCRPGKSSGNWPNCSNAVQVVPGLNPSLSSEDELVEAVLALATPATPSGSPPTPPPVYQLPAETADAAFDRILTTWVVEVRPQLAPDPTGTRPQLGSVDPAVHAHRHAAGALLHHQPGGSSPTATRTTPGGPTSCRPR